MGYQNNKNPSKASLETPDLLHHQTKRHNRNNYRMQGNLTYSKLISSNQQALLKHQILTQNAQNSLPFHKKFSQQHFNNDEMEIHSNPTFFYPNYDHSTPEDMQCYSSTLDRQVSDFGHQERYESGDRSMISACSSKTFNTSGPCFSRVKHNGVRNKSTIRNNSSNRYKTDTCDNLTDLSDRETQIHHHANIFTRRQVKGASGVANTGHTTRPDGKGKKYVKERQKETEGLNIRLQNYQAQNAQLKSEVQRLSCELTQMKTITH